MARRPPTRQPPPPRDFSVYLVETGRIVRYGSCPGRDFEAQAREPGEAVFAGAFRDDEYYIAGGSAVERPKLLSGQFIELVAGEVLQLPGVPAGTLIHIGTDGYYVEDGEFEFSSAKRGVFFLSVEPGFPYQLQSAQVTVR